VEIPGEITDITQYISRANEIAEREAKEEEERLKSVRSLNSARLSQYVSVAVKSFNERLSQIKKPGRNKAIHHEAYSMGRLINSGKILEDELIEVLFDCARITGLVSDDGKEAVMKTIRSGLNAGKSNPIII
jgi:hypothetical protein